MNNWLKIGVPILIAVLLITATVGITLAVVGRGAGGQVAAPALAQVQVADTQYARTPLCPNCPGYGQGGTANGQDNSTGTTYVPQGATCPNCPGYAQSTAGQTTSYRGGCCSGR